MPVWPSMAPWTPHEAAMEAHGPPKTILETPKNAPPCLKGDTIDTCSQAPSFLIPISLDFWGNVAHVTDEAKLHFAAYSHDGAVNLFLCDCQMMRDRKKHASNGVNPFDIP